MIRYVPLGLVAAPLFLAVAFAATELPSAIATLEDAFRADSAAALRPFLSSEHRVQLALREVHRDSGLFGADQISQFFSAFFAKHETRSFAVDRDSVEATGGAAIFKARWQYRRERGGERTLTLRLTLVAEDGRWLVREIRGARD